MFIAPGEVRVVRHYRRRPWDERLPVQGGASLGISDPVRGAAPLTHPDSGNFREEGAAHEKRAQRARFVYRCKDLLGVALIQALHHVFEAQPLVLQQHGEVIELGQHGFVVHLVWRS
ncbi:hypothetical protein D3C78_1657270 [compost metagenome]